MSVRPISPLSPRSALTLTHTFSIEHKIKIVFQADLVYPFLRD